MNDRFQNKYRIPSARMVGYDYSTDGAYFITICTQEMYQYFGKIENNVMKLSQVGVIADLVWYEMKNHAQNVELDAFVVMPNHIHGVLILNHLRLDKTSGYSLKDNELDNPTNLTKPNANFSKSQSQILNHSEIVVKNNEKMSEISPKSNSISTLIRSYKSAVTKHCNRLGFEFAWQTRFHDHIVRNAQSYDFIRNYILNNPSNWENDKFYGA